MELGESIAVTLFVEDNEKHSVDTCPWHRKKEAKAKKMKAQDGDEDASGMMPDNNGKTLGNNLADDDNPAPTGRLVSVYYEQTSVVRYMDGKKKKKLQIYEEVAEEEEYPLQFAPHHLIPGNESLKGTLVVAFLGDDDVIENFKNKGKPASYIKKDMSVGYDVNSAMNGAWLPSPYALSMRQNQWPAAEGIKALRKRNRDGVALELEEFKMAYAAAAIEEGDAQFHMRHVDYSKKVRAILEALGAKLKLLASKCRIAADGKDDEKFDPPGALGARLDTLSGKLRGLLKGKPTGWRNPLFTDELSLQYFKDFKGRPKTARALRVM